MFDYLPTQLLPIVAWLSFFILVGGAAAIVVWFVKRFRNYFDENKSAVDD